MKYCTHCGKPLDDQAAFCPGCGRPAQKLHRTDNTTPYLVWSILLIVFCNPVSFVLGVIALVEVISVRSAPNAPDAAKKLGTARTLCIVATCVDAAILLFGTVFRIFAAFTSWLWPTHWGSHWFIF